LAFLAIAFGLALLAWSADRFVEGSAVTARHLGMPPLLIIGLTIVAVGTSLPELASSIVAARKGEHDMAIGNVIGSNLFNTLAVVGIAGTILPFSVGPEVFYRDIPVLAALTLSLFVIGYGLHGPGRVNRFEGAALLTCFFGYTGYLVSSVFMA
jgi:cation:H+ antiporter